MRKYLITIFSLLTTVPFCAFAVLGSQGGSLNPIQAGSFMELVENILNIVTTIAIPITAIAIVYIGFWFVSAQGNPGEINKAKEALMWTLAGFAILLGARAIVAIIKTTVTSLG